MAAAAMASLFLLSLFFFTSFSPTSSFASSRTSFASSDSQKVSLSLYYESLCPYCANFIVNHLAKIFDNGLISIVDLKLSPYGNAKIGSDATIACQHGPSECLLNTVEACAINAWPNLEEHFPFIYCIENFTHEHKYLQWVKCFQKLQLNPTPILDCYTSGQGKDLELKHAAETDALQPPHTYVPWVVVDGQPLYEDYENFTSYVCKAYKGTDTPKICSELSLLAKPAEGAGTSNTVTYAEKNTDMPVSTIIRSGAGSFMGMAFPI